VGVVVRMMSSSDASMVRTPKPSGSRVRLASNPVAVVRL
jgi:hypothetical protein